MALDYGSILQAGQRLVPDLRAQLLQDEQMQMQRDVVEQRNQVFAAQQAQAGAAMQRQQAFERDRDNALARNDPNAIRDLMIRYPEFADAIKPAWEAMDEGQRRGEYTRLGSIYARGSAGDFDGAAANLRRWLDAEREAGRDDPQAAAILQALESGSDVEKRAAIGQVGILISAIDPDKFGETFGKLQPSAESKTGVQREYEWRVGQFGQEAADSWLSTQDVDLVVGEPGAPIFDKRDFVRPGSGPTAVTPQPKGGDPSTGGATAAPVSDGGSVIKGLFPEARITDTKRDPNSSLGKANPGSWHVQSGGAVDVAPIPGLSFGQYLKRIRDAGYTIIEARDEVKNPSGHATGPHWHVVLGGGPGAPQRVRSIQEAQRLAPGTRYTTPDGREFVR